MEQVTCRDCVHSFVKWYEWPFPFGDGRNTFTRCRLAYVPAEQEFDPVRGMTKRRAYYKFASTERLARFGSADAKCGPEGRNWVPKDKKNFFVLLKRV